MGTDRIYSMDDLARLFRLPKRSDAVRMCQRKEIRSFRRRGCYYVWESAVVEYLIRRHYEKSPAHAGT